MTAFAFHLKLLVPSALMGCCTSVWYVGGCPGYATQVPPSTAQAAVVNAATATTVAAATSAMRFPMSLPCPQWIQDGSGCAT